MISYRCPRCLIPSTASSKRAGETVYCTDCGQAVLLPRTDTPLPALPPEEEPKQVRVYFGTSADAQIEFYSWVAFGIIVVLLLIFCFCRRIGGELGWWSM